MLVPQSEAIVDVLILGAGWTSTFLIPLLSKENITYAATSTSGRDGTIKFVFDPSNPKDTVPFQSLPSAQTILITFPLKGKDQTDIMLDLYKSTHEREARWIQLGSTGIFSIPEQTTWVTRQSAYSKDDLRGQAEDQLLERGGTVLNLSGLWGGQRQPSDWVGRVAKSKKQLAEKGSLHMIHGQDVARSIIGVHKLEKFPAGERWVG
jgi:hypothetical protein